VKLAHLPAKLPGTVDPRVAWVNCGVLLAVVSMPAAYEFGASPNIVGSTEKQCQGRYPLASIFCSVTQLATWARVLKLSLVRMCSRWLSTVRSER